MATGRSCRDRRTLAIPATLFLFLDPNDNNLLVVAMTLQGFITAGEAVNFSVFDHLLTYGFELETTGNARPDRLITRSDSLAKAISGATPQTATITIERRNGRRLARFRALTTPSNLSGTSARPGGDIGEHQTRSR